MRERSVPAVIAVVFAVAGCHDKGLVAKVGDTRLFQADVDVSAARVGTSRALESAAETALLAEGAKERGILDDAHARASADAAYREALGHALLDRAMKEATSEEKLRARYEKTKDSLKRRRVHVAQIFVKAGPSAQAKMSVVLSRLRGGEKFDALAKELSDDPPTAARGGELAPIDEGTTDKALFAAAAKLERGEVSDVITSPSGMRVLTALDEPTTITPTFEQARGALAAEAMRDARRDLLEELRKTIPVKIEKRAVKR